MLSTANTKYPYFELIEIVPELELGQNNYRSLSPVKAGNFVPAFSLGGNYDRWQQFYNGAETHGLVLLRTMINKPLVISFYSRHWKSAGLEQLRQLHAIRSEIQAQGGSLIVINSDNHESLHKLAWENSLSLNFYYDQNNEIAKKFRIYSDDNPSWNNFSGIDTNAPLIATYVLDPVRHVVFSHIDHELSGQLPVKEILAATYNTALELTAKKSA